MGYRVGTSDRNLRGSGLVRAKQLTGNKRYVLSVSLLLGASMLAGCTATTIDTQSLQPVGAPELSATTFSLNDQAGVPTPVERPGEVAQAAPQLMDAGADSGFDPTQDEMALAALVPTESNPTETDLAAQAGTAPGTQPLASATDDTSTQRIMQASNAPAGTQTALNPTDSQIITNQSSPIAGAVDTTVALAQAPAPSPVPQAIETASAPAPVAAASAFGAAPTAAAVAPEPRRTGIFRAMFNRERIAPPAPVREPRVELASLSNPAEQPKPQAPERRVISTVSASSSSLPGVSRDRALGVQSPSASSGERIQVASAAGLARLAPNGLKTQHSGVDIQCLKPALVRILKQVEGHYGKAAVVTSGYRSPARNNKARGAKNSLHMYCAAADIQVDGVSKWQLASYLRSMPGRGGVGTYCHTQSVHIDIGPTRDWNARCRRR